MLLFGAVCSRCALNGREIVEAQPLPDQIGHVEAAVAHAVKVVEDIAERLGVIRLADAFPDAVNMLLAAYAACGF